MSIVFQSRAMLQVLERARKYARSSVAVLLCGESGTGKELVAKLIHDESPRRSSNYVRLNCAALSETLMESELFGHESGAFTGAQWRRCGRIESAGAGTVFLDEVGELPSSSQAKLLRVLEEREFQRVGGNETLHFSGRFIAATNRDLEEEIQACHFREDLYHRLNVLHLHLPPLRERREDIPPLVQHFIHQAQSELEHPVAGVTRRAMRTLCDYDWPGNVRELKNVILRFCLLSTSEMVDEVELPEQPRAAAIREVKIASHSVEAPQVVCAQADPRADILPMSFECLSLEEIERQVIIHRLRVFHGNKSEAAAALGVTPRTLRNKVQHYRKLGFIG